MGKTYKKVMYHVIWSTKDRQHLIDSKNEEILKKYINQKIIEYGGFYYECNMVEDHIHILCEIPLTVSVSSFIAKLKGSSSHQINRFSSKKYFLWQRGFSIFSVGRCEFDVIKKYIQNQKEHHK